MGWLQKRRVKKWEKRFETNLDAEFQQGLSEASAQLDEIERKEQKKVVEKQSPVQDLIVKEDGSQTVKADRAILTLYLSHETAQRGVGLITDALADIDIDIKEPTVDNDPARKVRIRPRMLSGKNVPDRKVPIEDLVRLLNYQPNLHQSKQQIFGRFWLDYIIFGNAFLYYDKTGLYHLRADLMEVTPGVNRHIKEYKYSGLKEMNPENIIHIKDNNPCSQYLGISRLVAAKTSGTIMSHMSSFQSKFFQNGAILGLVLKSDNVLGPKLKAKLLRNWRMNYNASQGGRRPIVLDGGLSAETVGISTYKDLDFDVGYENRELRILKALGVPPILLDSGNNANLRPNVKLFYEQTILPAFNKLIKELEVFFGYDMRAVIETIPSLQPDLSEKATFLTTLVNGGLITVNEGRAELRKPAMPGEENNTLRIPQNIVGSAVNPDTGGRPEGTGDDGESN